MATMLGTQLDLGMKVEFSYEKPSGEKDSYEGFVADLYENKVGVQTPNGYRCFLRERMITLSLK